ncbi:MAG: oxygenase MpaB family protein [Chloroflexi bacterium]|nr:oxygenase MpaB family protein [Chloroflexota bacterium]
MAEDKSPEGQSTGLPSCYIPGYEKARALDPELATRYVDHTLIGDPVADAMMEDLAPLGQQETARILQAGIDGKDDDTIRNAPASVREFFKELENPPDWVDLSALQPGVRMFHRNAKVVLAAMIAGVLVEGFSTNISKSFFITGRLGDQGVRRLKQNNRHMVEIFMPGGLDKGGDGWKLSVRVRLVHAQVRRLLAGSDDWDAEDWGTPVSPAHVGFAITAFSARLLKHMKSLGAKFEDEERASFMQIWRYSGYLMGIPETILFREEEDALRLFEIGRICEPAPDVESMVMANSLINSAPLLVGTEDPAGRRSLAKYIFSVSRALIGKELADSLMYPVSPTIGVLAWFRLQGRYQRFVSKYLPKLTRETNFTTFTSLLQVSVFDEEGVSYRLPDHVYAEESSRW